MIVMIILGAVTIQMLKIKLIQQQLLILIKLLLFRSSYTIRQRVSRTTTILHQCLEKVGKKMKWLLQVMVISKEGLLESCVKRMMINSVKI